MKIINFNKPFPFVKQKNQLDCGIACISMISKYYGKNINYTTLQESSNLSKEGVSFQNISDTLYEIGIENIVVEFDIEQLLKQSEFPCILHWNDNHFVVLYKIKKKIYSKSYDFFIADPAHDLIKINDNDFKSHWLNANNKGFVQFLDTTEEFFKMKNENQNVTFYNLFNYLKPFKWDVSKIFITLIISSLLTLIFPFLTEKLVDKGINPKDMNFVALILLAQLSLFFGQTVLEIVRNRISLFIGSKININIISDFLGKLMLMPLKYFDSKMIGDLTQRIQDHKRIENFLTSQSILTIFSLINFSVFFFVLAYYNLTILFIYVSLTFLSILWVLYFQKKRKNIDYQRFNVNAENQEKTYELITGIQEIKLNNFEKYKKEQWKSIQEKLFKVSFKVLNIDQLQLSGYDFINNLKNIIVTFVVAANVIDNKLTIGAMLSISYIIGEMNSPISHLVNFFRSLQDAKLSYSRLEEINNYQDSEKHKNTNFTKEYIDLSMDIKIENLSFSYDNSTLVLQNLNFTIPKNKTTAIVGVSGSGKTTLLKILLKYYKPNSGKITVGNHDFENFNFEYWRQFYGVVMQDGYIFSETIERNIATSDESINYKQLQNAIEIANLTSFIEQLPLGIKTPIGISGNGISGGQKQRILIARAIYKNSKYLFFDEASSNLDAENENLIMNNLNKFIKNRTAIIVAHRLSTVKNADQIIVLKNGEIAEIGNHQQLVHNKADYYNLVKNQLELGN
jgi:ATP-binding cassette subfamily B protein